MTWTDATTPLDPGVCNDGCWADDLAEFVGVGRDDAITEAIIRSVDGKTWIYESSPFDGGTGYGVARSIFNALTVAVGIGADETDAIVTSPDDITWAGSGNPFYGPGAAAAAAVRVSDGALVLAGADWAAAEQFALSTDDGADWVAAAVDSNASGAGVAVRDSDDLILVAGASAGPVAFAAVSADGGATWSVTQPFGSGIGYIIGCAIRQSDGALVVVGQHNPGNFNVAISTDSGVTWTTHQPFGSGGTAYGVAVRESDGAIVAVGTNAANTKQLAYSTDNGTSWSQSAPFGTGSGHRAQGICVRVSDGAFIAAGVDAFAAHQLAISTNSGSTWTTYAPFGSGHVGIACAVRQSDGLLVVAGGDADVAVSSDGGPTWSVTFPGFVAAVAVRESDGLLLGAGSGGVGGINQAFVSADSGSTWTHAGAFVTPQGRGTCVAVNDTTGTVLVGAFGNEVQQLARSTDAINYAIITSSPFAGGASVIAGIAYSPGEARWIVSGLDIAGTPLVAISDDDGLTWTENYTVPMDASNGIIATIYRDEANGAWWLLGQMDLGGSLAISTDGGTTWAEVSTPLDPVAGSGYARAMANLGSSTFALGGLDKTGTEQMCLSRDNGATWVLDTSPSPFGSAPAYALAYSSSLGLAVAFGGI